MIAYFSVCRFCEAMITGSQIRAARALLGWSQRDLADRAVLSETAVLKLETGGADSRTSTLLKARQSLEAAGVEFINRADGATGVLLRTGNKA